MSIVENIYLKKDSFVLDVPTLEVADVGLTVVTGPSGAGKTLFLKTLMGLELSEKNMKWIFKGEDLAKLSPPARKLGVVFQGLELFPHLSAKENILFHAEARKISSEESNLKLKELVSMAKLEERLQHKVSVLSGGEKQRVAILRAIIGKPRILLLDEPFSSLDGALKNDLRSFLKALLVKENIPCILVSHDPADHAIADKLIAIENGKIKS